MNPWILSNLKRDALFILLPGYITFLIIYGINLPLLAYNALSFFIFAIIDSGHVYNTLWRTYFNAEERKSSKLYLLVPLVIFIGILLWFYFQIPYLWSFIFYATVYHHLRQYYGVMKWYEKKSFSFSAYSGKFLYALCLLPSIASHFRGNLRLSFYTSRDFLHYPNQKLFLICCAVHLLLVVFWLGYELYSYRRGRFHLQRFLSILFPTGLYSLTGYIAVNSSQVLMPLIMAHGIPYIALMGISLRKSRPDKYNNYKMIFIILVSTAIIFGSCEYFFEQFSADLNDQYLFIKPSLLQSVLVSLYLIPVLCHYAFDAIIWRRKHREASLIYG
jgi:hypothetical protein